MRTIGICRALHAYDSLALWQGFIERLGFRVLVSEPTDREMVDAGVRIAPAELCLPAKVFLGHVLSLKDRVDALFIPRPVCRKMDGDRYYGCPKALALPDMTKALVEDLPPVVELCVDEREGSEDKAYRELAAALGSNGRRWKAALREARAAAGEAAARVFSDEADDGPAIGVIGHSYLLRDKVLSLDLLGKLEKVGARAVLAEDVAARPDLRPEFVPNWSFELELIDAGAGMLEAGVDGLLLASSFACGTSAVTNDIIRRMARQRASHVPVLEVFFDEHSAEAGLVTRLESFVDLIRMRGEVRV